MNTDAEKLAAAMKAVRHVLGRITGDHNLAYLMGHCTESYDLLCAAVALESGKSQAEVQDHFPPCPPPGTPTRAERESLAALSIHQRRVCEVLNVAPFVAAILIAFAEGRGTPLRAYYADGNDDAKLNFTEKAHGVYLAWCERRRLKQHLELAA